MKKKSYWLDLFTGQTWNEFIQAGANISGFRETRWVTMKRIEIGDYLLCYIAGLSRFVGLLEVISKPFQDNTAIWKDENFPCRLKVKPIILLTPETAIPVHTLKDLSFFQNMKTPNSWTGSFRSSPSKWKERDGEIIVNAIKDACENPVKREFDDRKFKYRPKGLKSKLVGTVSLPQPEIEDESRKDKASYTEHTQIQWMLMKLGSDMGFDIWVARNDKGKEYKGKKFLELPRIKSDLPQQFDEVANRTIEMIDVIWLKGNSFIAAFEIEATTSIYSGLLRMSDLVAMIPNVAIPLYLVAPDDKREKVITEINRATFSKLSPRLSEICRFISFQELKKQIEKAESFLQYLKPEFLEQISESCELEEL